MNKILSFLILVTFLSISSCGSYAISGNEKEFLTEFSITDLLSVSIDTTAIYKLHSSWIGPYDFNSKIKKNYSVLKEYKDIYGSGLLSDQFIKINKNRKLNFYNIPKDKPIKCKSFNNNPALFGIYDIHKKVIYTKRFIGIGHGPKLIRGKAMIKEDTLHLIEKIIDKTRHSLYLKIDCNM